MALATRCPHCRTTFRVAQDQLKLRAGVVRCGACKQIFNGVEHLLQSDALPSSKPAPSSPSHEAASTAMPRQFGDVSAPSPATPGPAESMPVSLSSTESEPKSQSPVVDTVPAINPASKTPLQDIRVEGDNGYTSEHAAVPAPEDPLQRMTLMDFSGFEDEKKTGHDGAGDEPPGENADGTVIASLLPPSAGTTEPDDLERTIDELQRKPWRSPKKRWSKNRNSDADSDDSPEPGFVLRARRQQRFGRTVRILMAVCSLVLLVTLLAQALYVFRNQIAARAPQAAPALTQACATLGCRVGLPAQIDLVSIESSELQAAATAPNTFTLAALLRNRGSVPQAWPNIELTLNDSGDKPIARRVFTPRDYVPMPQDQIRGFAGNSEQSVKLTFTVSQLQASGYRIYLFYP